MMFTHDQKFRRYRAAWLLCAPAMILFAGLAGCSADEQGGLPRDDARALDAAAEKLDAENTRVPPVSPPATLNIPAPPNDDAQ